MTDGTPESNTVPVERTSPDEVFSLLGDDIRVDILETLAETPDEPIPFGELLRGVDVSDSGQFNYHLGKLRGSFVRRTDDGYELTHAGRQIVGAMLSGTYTANATIDGIETDGTCPLCDGAIVASYADEAAVMRCTDCGDWRNEFSFPPGSLDQFEREALPYAFDRWMQHVFRGVVDGFCHTCAGRMDGRVVVDDPEDRLASVPAHVEYECNRCGSTVRASASLPATFHPAVQGFLYDHGVDLSRTPTWHLGEFSLPDVSLDAEDPPRLTIRFESEEEAMVVTMAADTRISDVERVSATE